MTAHSNTFPWPSHAGHYEFFEQRMHSHGKVSALKGLGDGIYELQRSNGDALRVFVCECYAFGVAEYAETLQRIGAIDAVIINSAWCGYSPEAKWECRQGEVGLFKIGEFMASLHRDDYWNYLTDAEQEYFEKSGLL